MYTIETERLGLRRWKESDLPLFAEMNRNPQVMEYFPKVLLEEESNSFVDKINASFKERGFGLWAVEIKSTGEFIGFVGFSVPRFEADFTPCVEIGWRLDHKYWGYGYATEAARACFEYGFNQLGLKEIVSFTSELNTNSINVMKKIGMKFMKEFDHPSIESGHRLRRHVLYRIGKEN